jgi:hypothetical protein
MLSELLTEYRAEKRMKEKELMEAKKKEQRNKGDQSKKEGQIKKELQIKKEQDKKVKEERERVCLAMCGPFCLYTCMCAMGQRECSGVVHN